MIGRPCLLHCFDRLLKGGSPPIATQVQGFLGASMQKACALVDWRQCRRSLAALPEWYEGALISSHVKLTRATDTLFWIFDHFFPLGDPADSTGKRK